MDHFPVAAPEFNGRSRCVGMGDSLAWLRQAWVSFVAWPGQWLALTIVFLVIELGLSIVPLIGQLAASLLTPLLVAGFIHAARKAATGNRPEVSDLFHGFSCRSSELLLLGVFSMIASLLIVLVPVIIGGGSLVSVVMAPYPLGVGVALGGMMFALLLSALLSIPLMMALWFSPALVLFNRMSPLPALRASFDACLKNVLPFLVYSLILLVLAFFAALPALLGYLVLIPIVFASMHAAYRDIFLAD